MVVYFLLSTLVRETKKKSMIGCDFRYNIRYNKTRTLYACNIYFDKAKKIKKLDNNNSTDITIL